MLDCAVIFRAFADAAVTFFAGVPDSVLKHLCAYIADHADAGRHIIAANEGGAIAVAAGHYLATGQCACVYSQNAGQGNTINPLTSLADPQVHGIPLLLLLGWRGEPERHDEPQHLKQGRVTIPLLQTLEIPWDILPEGEGAAAACLQRIVKTAIARSGPAAVVVRDGAFAPYQRRHKEADRYALSREEALKLIVGSAGPHDILVSSTGKMSRELYEYRVQRGENPGRDFLCVGAMGHASQIALGIAMAKPQRRVLCLDGDGALLMHMGSLAVIGQQGPANFVHVVLNNGAHESVGGQPTAGFSTDLPGVARSCGYRIVASADNAPKLVAALEQLKSSAGPQLLEVRVALGARADLGRPATSPRQNKQQFMEFLQA
ncbi:MAG: phosphonopyruvate decarboxylase [Deltaproteobacteria bacterium]|nr:phosphonopyruvate decarboxylase [Deltaproteobacteria bacterium]